MKKITSEKIVVFTFQKNIKYIYIYIYMHLLYQYIGMINSYWYSIYVKHINWPGGRGLHPRTQVECLGELKWGNPAHPQVSSSLKVLDV